MYSILRTEQTDSDSAKEVRVLGFGETKVWGTESSEANLTKRKGEKDMKTTYTRTLFVEDLAKARVKIYIYDGSKYEEGTKEMATMEYTGVTSWDIIQGGEEAEEIEANGLIDEDHEYLVLHFEDGETTATYRNGHVDMFIR